MDIAVNRASLKALKKAGLVTDEDYKALLSGLKKVEQALASGELAFRTELEDIHTHIERALAEHVGPKAGVIHTGRSRNDQVATDTRLFVKEACGSFRSEINRFLLAAADRAEETLDVILPAYTHLQRAQPVLFAHWLLAYAQMLLRDRERFAFAEKQADSLPLGAGAGTGNPFGLDQELMAGELGFSRVCQNSLDAVSDRDFVLDFCYAAAVLQIHLSRLCEDLVIWSSSEFGFVRLASGLTTGSSMMPQKRNPDSAELVRGKTGRVVGNLTALMVLLKGLPMTYDRDLQEDKERLFDSVDTALASLRVMERVVRTMEVDRKRCEAALSEGYPEATAVADYLTRKGLPFRSAYEIAGRIVADLLASNRRFQDLSLKEWRSYSELFEPDVEKAIKPEAMVEARNGIGGTAPAAVKRQIQDIRSQVK